jgi:hypothetical protein
MEDCNVNIMFCSFFVCPKNEPKKGPETPTPAFLSARYTSLNGATKKPVVRTVSGLATAPIPEDLGISETRC